MEVPKLHKVRNPVRGKRRRANLKVVYISNPLMVTTCASKFRALVQELTGQHSDVSRLMESRYDDPQVPDRATASPEPEPQLESPTSSGSLLEPPNEACASDGFLDLLQWNMPFNASELDVLGSYDAL